MNLSICIITKNEEQNIVRCLQCLTPYDFEVIVVDTGSTDRTKEIAATYTEHVYDFVWCDDFAAAKNFAVSKASNPHVMVLDSDEFVDKIDVKQLELLISTRTGAVGRIRRRNILTRNGEQKENVEWINRIFAKDKFYYKGRIHEQVTAVDGQNYDTYQAPVVIMHTGYDLPEAERKKKAERNIALLQQELERLLSEQQETELLLSEQQKTQESSHLTAGQDAVVNTESQSVSAEGSGDSFGQIPYILYQLGKSYYMAEDYVTACEYFSKGLSYDLNPKLEYVIDMVETYGYALINSGQVETALFFENIYEEFGNSADFQFLMGLIYMKNARFEDAVGEFKKATKHAQCRMVGVNDYMAYYNIGVIYECLGRTDEARKYYEKCGEYEAARKRLQVLQA